VFGGDLRPQPHGYLSTPPRPTDARGQKVDMRRVAANDEQVGFDRISKVIIAFA
jgi:hypothetical protein